MMTKMCLLLINVKVLCCVSLAQGQDLTSFLGSDQIRGPVDTIRIIHKIMKKEGTRLDDNDLTRLKSIANPKNATRSLTVPRDILNHYKNYQIEFQVVSKSLNYFYYNHERIYGDLPIDTYVDTCRILRKEAAVSFLDSIIPPLIHKIAKSQDLQYHDDLLEIIQMDDPQAGYRLLSPIIGVLDPDKAIAFIQEFKKKYKKSKEIENELDVVMDRLRHPEKKIPTLKVIE